MKVSSSGLSFVSSCGPKDTENVELDQTLLQAATTSACAAYLAGAANVATGTATVANGTAVSTGCRKNKRNRRDTYFSVGAS